MTELKPLIDYVPEPQRSFLSQPLTRGMFVPCDEDGNPTNEPDEAALDRVIFDGFEVEEDANDSDVIMVSSDNIGIDFYPDGAVFMWKMHEVGWDFKEEVKTISYLCGLGLKLKER